jgi:hypothetical protein
VCLYRAAMAGFDRLDMRLTHMVAQRRLGELLGGTAGQALVALSDTWMDAQRVRAKDRLAQLIAPAARPSSGLGCALSLPCDVVAGGAGE